MSNIKIAALFSIAFLGFTPADDMTEMVSGSERLSKVFERKNVSEPTNMQMLIIKLCESLESCGR